MIYVARDGRVCQWDSRAKDGPEPPSDACPDCLAAVKKITRPGESVRCGHRLPSPWNAALAAALKMGGNA